MILREPARTDTITRRRAPDITVQPMDRSDLDVIIEIENRCFGSPWPAAAFRSAIEDASIDARTAKNDNRIVGYVVACRFGRRLLIANAAVNPGYRRRGIGRHLLRGALSRGFECGTRQAMLDVRQSNLAAITLYRDLGFEIAGVKRNYYSTPNEDAFSMTKRLG